MRAAAPIRERPDAAVPPLLPTLAIAVPVLDEERLLPGLLDHLQRIGGWDELAVIDGGSRDRTLALALGHPAKPAVLAARGGRAAQLNLAMERLRSEVVLVLAADLRPHASAPAAVRRAYGAGARAGCLRLFNSRRTAVFRWQDAWARLRARWTGGAYLDQAPFFDRRAALARGGFRPLRGYDTADLGRRLGGRGGLALLRAPVVASCRHWQQYGLLRGTLAHQRVRLSRLAGAR